MKKLQGSQLTKAVALLLLLTFLATPALAKVAVGTITRTKDGVTMNGTAASKGDTVYEGATFVTGEEGRVEISFNDETTLVLGGGTEFIIDSYTYGTETDAKDTVLRLTAGAFRAATSAIVDLNPDNFHVITPLATIGIRGTDFWGGYLSEIEFDVVMLKGTGVVVTSMGGSVVLEEAGQGTSIPDPIKHPQGFSKALQKPELKRWGASKLTLAAETVEF